VAASNSLLQLVSYLGTSVNAMANVANASAAYGGGGESCQRMAINNQ